MNFFKKLFELSVIFVLFGLMYMGIEYLWRGYSFIEMAAVGGLAGICIGCINEVFPWDTPVWVQCIIGGAITTVIEFASGCYLNIYLGLNMWDYSNMPFNILGQVCLPFSLMWALLSLIAIVSDDWLKYWLFGEEKPHYVWW